MKVTLLVFTLALPGCAFQSPAPGTTIKEEPRGEARAEPSPSPRATEPALPPASIRLSWWKDEKTKDAALTRTLVFNREARLLASNNPVTLPVQVPEQIELELAIPTRLAEINADAVVVHWVKSSVQLLVPKQLQVIGTDAELTTVLIDVAGLPALLNGAVQDQGELQVLVRRPSGEVVLSVKQVLRTPPALLVTEQGTPVAQDFEGLDEQMLRKVELGPRRWDLVSVLRVQNRTGAPIEVEFPTRGRFGLQLFYKKIQLKNGPCSHLELMTTGMDELSRENWLVPLSAATPETLVSFASGSTQAQTTNQIEAGAWLRVGVYLAGDRVPEVADGKLKLRKFETQKVVSHCDAKCDDIRMGSWEFPTCWASVGMREGYAPFERERVEDCKLCTIGKQPECDRCELWERLQARYLARGPNCLYCGVLQEVGRTDTQTFYRAVPKWQQVPVEIDAQVGFEDQKVVLVAGSGDGLVRWSSASEPKRQVALWRNEERAL